LVTSRAAWGIDDDMPLLKSALDAVDIEWRELAWDDDLDDTTWASCALSVVRSTWDYHRRLDDFHAWIDRVDRLSVLANSADVLRWNTDKHYLLEAHAAGLPIVPTVFVEPSSDDSWIDRVDRMLATGHVVVKPCVSAGSNDTERHDESEAAVQHVRSLLAVNRSVMVQPYLSRVDSDDETGLVFMGGSFSHAFAKGPLLSAPKDVAGDLFARERIEPREPSAAELSLGERAMAWLDQRFGTLLYARIDLLPTDDGPVIVELELTEPSLFLAMHPDAPANIARAIGAALSER
jgi:glutathione synthase/RimK-type ligase-like ATP-grasp enzyme